MLPPPVAVRIYMYTLSQRLPTTSPLLVYVIILTISTSSFNTFRITDIISCYGQVGNGEFCHFVNFCTSLLSTYQTLKSVVEPASLCPVANAGRISRWPNIGPPCCWTTAGSTPNPATGQHDAGPTTTSFKVNFENNTKFINHV